MNKKIGIILTGFIFLAILVGVACLKFLPDFGVKEDALVYDEIALNLSLGKGFLQNNTPSGEAPGYPFFLSFIFSILGHNFAYVKVIQFAILGLMAGTSFLIAFKFLKFSLVFSLLAGVAVIFWPYFLLYSNLVLTEILFTFFLVSSVLLTLIFKNNPSYLKAGLLGVWLGLGALIRPTALLLPFWLFLAFVVFLPKFREKNNFLKLCFIVCAFLISLTPWTIRNYIVFDKFVPVHPRFQEAIQKSYVQLDYFNYNPNKEKPTEKPSIKEVFVAKIKNVYYFWNPGAGGWQIEILKEKRPLAGHLVVIYKIGFFVILGLAFYSLRYFKNKNLLLLSVVIAYFWGVHTMLYPYPRYTLPIIPFVIILGLFSLQKLLVPKKS